MEVLLLARGEEFAVPWAVENVDTFRDRDAARREDLRRVVVHASHLGGALYYVLWWGDTPVPLGLDERVAAGTVTVGDLAEACAAEFGGITCLSCHAQFYALVCDTAHPLLSVTRPPPPEAWQHGCPVCGERVALPILEVLDVDGSPAV